MEKSRDKLDLKKSYQTVCKKQPTLIEAWMCLLIQEKAGPATDNSGHYYILIQAPPSFLFVLSDQTKAPCLSFSFFMFVSVSLYVFC